MRASAVVLAAALAAPAFAQVEVLEAPAARQHLASPAKLKVDLGKASGRTGDGDGTTMLSWSTSELASVSVGTLTVTRLTIQVSTGRKGGRVAVTATTTMDPGTDQDVRLVVSLHDGDERVLNVSSLWWNHDEGKTEQRTFAGRQDQPRAFWLDLAERGASLHVEIAVKPQS